MSLVIAVYKKKKMKELKINPVFLKENNIIKGTVAFIEMRMRW